MKLINFRVKLVGAINGNRWNVSGNFQMLLQFPKLNQKEKTDLVFEEVRFIHVLRFD